MFLSGVASITILKRIDGIVNLTGVKGMKVMTLLLLESLRSMRLTCAPVLLKLNRTTIAADTGSNTITIQTHNTNEKAMANTDHFKVLESISDSAQEFDGEGEF